MGKEQGPEPKVGGLTSFLREANKDLAPLRPVATEAFKQTQKVKQGTRPVNVKAGEYRDYITDFNAESEDIDLQRAQGQSGVEQLVNSIGQFGAQAVAGASMALGTSLDIEQAVNTITGSEKEYKNLLYDFGKDLIESSGKAMPIYEEKEGEINFSDPAFWGNMFAQTGLSVGIMGEAIAESVALTALTGGGGLGSLANKVRNIKGLKGLMQAGTASGQLRRVATTFGVINRHHEGVMEAADSFDNEYKTLVSKGYSKEQATEVASKAASNTYLANLPLMALDVLSFRAMTFNPVSGASSGGMIDNVLGATLGKIANPAVAKAAAYGVNIASEAGEEFWQSLAQSEAKHNAETSYGIGTGKDFSERFKELSEKGDLWHSTIAGAFGGVVLGGVAHGFQKAMEGNTKKNLDKQYNDFVNNTTGIGLELANQIRVADENGEVSKANNLRRQMGIQKSLHSVHLDNLKDSDTAFTSHITSLQGVLDAVNSGDAEQIKALGVEGSEDFIKANVPNYLEDATKIKAIYDDVKENNAKEAIIPVTYRRFLVDSLGTQLNETKASIVASEAMMPDLSNLSGVGRAIYEAETNILHYQEQLKKAEALFEAEASPEAKEGLIADINNLNFYINKNKQILEEQSQVENPDAVNDKEIIQSVKNNYGLNKLKRQAVQLQSSLDRTRKELNIWSDPKFQRKNAQGKLLDVVKKATTLEDLDSAEANLVAQNILTDDFKDMISTKRAELKAAKEVEELRAKAPAQATITNATTFLGNFLANANNQTPPPSATPFGEAKEVETSDIAALTLNQGRAEIATAILPKPLVNEQATIIKGTDDWYDPAPINDNISDEQKNTIKEKINSYYNSLSADLGRKPTFKELVEDMINHTSPEQVDRNFHVISLGWELNNFPATDFNKVYNDLFGSRKSKAVEFLDFASQVTTEEGFKAEQAVLLEKQDQRELPPVQVTETDTGQKIFKHVAPYQTVVSTLKFAHLSRPYTETRTLDEEGNVLIDRKNNTDELNQGEYVDSKELLDPNKYPVGTKLSVRIPTDADKILIAQWTSEWQKSNPVTFGQWSANLDPSSDEYISRMPMIIHSPYSDKGVAFVHDTEWYNPANIGLEETPEEQAKVIAEAKAELLAFRKAVLANNGTFEIEITAKKPGSKSVIPSDKPLITVGEANPQALIGFPNDFGNMVVGDKVIPFTDLINVEDLDRGHKYDLRQIGLTEEGNPQYFAAKVHYGKLDIQAQSSVLQAIRVYISQFDKANNLADNEDIKKIRAEVQSQSGLDLFDQASFETYLNQFVQTYKGKAKTNKDIAEYYENEASIPTLTPWIAISEGRLVFGIKGMKLNPKEEKNGFAFYTHPRNFDKADIGILKGITTSVLKTISQPNFLGSISQNLNRETLEGNKNVVLLGYDNTTNKITTKPVGDYQTYLKTQLKTNLKSYDLGGGTYATFLQPVINFTYDGQQEQAPAQAPAQKTFKQLTSEAAAEVTGNPTVEQELIDDILSSMSDIENLGLSPEAMQALRDLGGTKFDPAYETLTDDIVLSIKTKLTKIEDLDTINRNTVVQFIANEIMSQIDPQKRNTVNKDDLKKHIAKSFDSIVAPKVAVVDAKVASLNKLYETGKYPALKVSIDEFNNLKANAEVLKKNWNFLINEAFEDYISKFSGISVTMSRDEKTVDVSINDENAPQELTEQEDDQQDWSIDSNDQREKDYSKESVEDNGKNSVSYLIKRFLSQIPSFDRNDKPKKGFMGLTTYPGFDTYYNLIGQIMASPVPVNSDFNDIIIRLTQHQEGKPWVKELIKRLEEADDQLKNAFMYNLRENISMKFVMYSYDSRTDSYKLKVYDTNANEILRVIQTRWKENFKQSPLSLINGEDYNINTVKAQQLLDQFNTWTSKSLPTQEEAQAWLNQFGIDVSNDAMTELYTKGYYATEGKETKKYLFSQMFEKSANTNGVFGRLAKYLSAMVAPGVNLDFQENDLVNPFEDSNGILKKLANIESKYSMDVTTNSFRDGSKTIYGYTPSKFGTAFLNMMKTDPKIIADKRQISFDQNSFILDLIENDPDFASKLSIDHLGINAFKELGKKLYQDNELNSLSDADHELVKLGMFQDTQQGEIKSKTFNGLKLRVARMFFPTMSDKKTMLNLTTAIVDLKTIDFTFTEDGTTEIGAPVKEFLFNQLIEPELKRIIAHHKKAKELGVSPDSLINQKGYNKAAQIFHFIPAMNNLMYKNEDNSETRLIEFLANSAQSIDDTLFETIKGKIKFDSNNLLDRLFNKLATDKIASWEKNGYVERTETGDVAKIKFLNNTYLNSKQGSLNEKLIVSAMDVTINYAIANANMHMLVAGDIANFSQDKAFSSKNFVDGNIFQPINESIYANISSDIIGVNLGKRLAMLIAPGNTLSQSKGDKYIQLFLKDRVSSSENIEFLIDLYHGKEALNKVQAEIDTINNSTDKEAVNKALGTLSETFPDIKDYFNIESTDAQEYTTTKEHLDVLYRQGRLPVEDYVTFINKIKEQKEAETNGQVIPDSALLSDAELKLIFQPIKPVYTGQINDVDNNVSRMVYIKSSSFPLIPQVTKAFPSLDGLRRKMEEIESKSNRNVRASYDTANKVGAVLGKNQLDIWDAQGNFIPDSIDVDDIVKKLEDGDDTSGLILPREFFRIQQDVPFKSSKIDHQDNVTLGTQMMKEIFGNGISQILDKVFTLNGEKVSGKELHQRNANLFDTWISSEKSKLYNQLGIDEATGEAIDKSKTVQKLQNILQQEAKKRGYPKQDIEALELDTNGNLGDIQFTIPLWLSPNSNRYESLLNAIVTNRLLNLDLPGSSFVVGSEEGFKTQKGLEGVDTSKVIWTDAWTGTLKAATFHENGNLKTAQVLVPSKFRNKSGKLLDLFSKGKNGEYLYVIQEENGKYLLKPEMIDSELLSIPSFRIPTSSHVSMSQLEIVGILPTEVGDLMIVPKNFTKQKGLDYDVDKENTYWLHHTLNDEGKLVQAGYEITLETIDEAIVEVKEGIDYLRERSQENKRLIEEYEAEMQFTNFIGYNSKDAKNFIKELRKDVTASQIKDAVNYSKELSELKTKLIQNEIIKTYSSVLSSSDRRVQEKINKVLSTDFAESQANLIDGLIRSNQDNTLFTTLSDEYQKYKMSLGAAGKLGIGVYSNYVVLHSLIEQSQAVNQLMAKEFDEETGVLKSVPFTITIGNLYSDGVLGKPKTLDGSRSITDVLAERQNTATDNEKLQIMGKANINEFTINVDNVLALAGFDKDTAVVNGTRQEVSIPYLFLSQPIIKDYVALMGNVKANISGYDANAEAKVIKKLIEKYSTEQEVNLDVSNQGLTGQKLVDNIIDKGTDGQSQQAVLELFTKLKTYGQTLGEISAKLNIQRNGLGKSIFEMMAKYDNVSKLEYNGGVSNISSLIGQYLSGDDYFAKSESELIAEGYTLFNDDKSNNHPFAVKPTTVTGSLVVHSAKAGYQLWSDYFPHQNAMVRKVIDDVVEIIGGEEVNETKAIQLQHEIFEELKKYLYSSSNLGIFKGDPQTERARLFFDRGDNQSLASYVRGVAKTNDTLSTNKLVSRFQYQLEQGALPSIIKFDNSKGEDFNEEYKYLALVELMDKNEVLPDYNGKPYSTRMLAKDLITYAYLEGGIQEAIQFVKYIPVPYLKEMGFAEKTQMWQRAAKGEYLTNEQGETLDLWKSMLGYTEKADSITGAPSRFAMQFIQHNASRLQKVDANTEIEATTGIYTEGKNTLENLQTFQLKEGVDKRNFVSVYNKDIKKGKSKFQIYQFDGESYHRVSTLGIFGMSEYSIKENNITPLIDAKFANVPIGLKEDVQPKPTVIAESQFGLDKGNLTDTITQIADANIAGVSEMARYLLPFIKNDVKLLVGVPASSPNARASYGSKTIIMNEKYVANPNTTKEELATTILHEYVHSITSDFLNQYYDNQGNYKRPFDQLPSEIQRIDRLFKEVQKSLGPEIEEFKQWYSKNPGTLRSPSDRILYAGMDIHEFTAMIMSEPAIQQRMSEIKYMATDRSLLDQFIEAIKKLLELGGVNFDENSVTAQAIDSIFKIVNLQKEQAQEFNSIFGTPIDPHDEDLGNLLKGSEGIGDEDSSDFLSPDDELNPDCIF